jgi:L-fuconate dehydratase
VQSLLISRFVKATTFRYITDAITPEEALELLKRNESGKKAREAEVTKRGYPAYTTSVGADAADDLRRGQLIRSIIDNPANMPKDRKPIDPESIKGKNAGPTGCVLMIDANRS